MDAEKLFEKLAADRNITVEEMKARIAQRIEEGWNSCDPRSREQWRQIPCAGEMPTLEEWLRYSMAVLREQGREGLVKGYLDFD